MTCRRVLRFSEATQEPLVDAKHVRNALSRFDQVEDVSDADRDAAFANIKAAAKHYDVEVSEHSLARNWAKPSHSPS